MGGIIDNAEDYRNATEEEKITHCVTQIVFDVINRNKKPLTSEEQSVLFERTVRQVRAERQKAFQVLTEAEEEIKVLTWNNILPQSFSSMHQTMIGRRVTKTLNSSHGFRNLFIVTFGNFVLAKDDNWIYRPTQLQMLNLVKRFPKKKMCENVANELREMYKMSKKEKEETYPDDPDTATIINTKDSKAMTFFKKQLLDQINELRQTV